MPIPQASLSVGKLHAARVFGATVLADLGLIANHTAGVDSSSQQLTGSLAMLMLAQLGILSLGGVSLLKGHSTGRWLAAAILCLNIGFLLRGATVDPVISGALILWQAVVLARMLEQRAKRVPVLVPTLRWLEHHAYVCRHLLAVSLAAWTVAFGSRIIGQTVALALCSLLALCAVAAALPFFAVLWHGGMGWRLVLLFLLPMAVGAWLGWPDGIAAGVVTFEALALLILLAQMPTQAEVSAQFLERPSALVVVTFFLLVVSGTVFLSFPVSSAQPGQSLSPIDALFTAASAACVTGLTVVDTGADLSWFGQLIVLGLIQMGGLGILVLSGFAVAQFGEGLGLRGQRALGESLDLSPGGASEVARLIVLSTLIIEAVGAACLAMAFAAKDMTSFEAAWSGLFHSVSAFCNAGFGLWPDSLEGFRGEPRVLLPVIVLVTLGGLGFPVLAAAWARFRGQRAPLSVHTKVVLTSSLALTLLGAVGYGASEWRFTMASLSLGERVLDSLFQSVTLRTAGFTVADLSAIAPGTFLWMLVFMFIGASPGSTGGGIKTTTAAVLASTIPTAMTGGKARAVLFGRAIPLESVYRATSIVVMGLGSLVILLTALLLTQKATFEALLFETVSALGTVGLSLGATSQLDAFGKLVIVVAMFIGRVGPLTLILMLRHRKASRLEYPEARIMVG